MPGGAGAASIPAAAATAMGAVVAEQPLALLGLDRVRRQSALSARHDGLPPAHRRAGRAPGSLVARWPIIPCTP
jgi:hypothetical protein